MKVEIKIIDILAHIMLFMKVLAKKLLDPFFQLGMFISIVIMYYYF